MPPTRRQPLRSQTKELLYNLHKHFKQLAEKDKSCVIRPTQMVANATGIPLSTVQRVLTEAKRATDAKRRFTSPKRTKFRESKINVDKSIIRKIIYNFLTENEVPTIKRLHEKLQAEINYAGCMTSLRKEVASLGFEWKKTEDRMILMEKHEIRYLRINYLLKIAEYRTQDRPIVYTGETCIATSHTSSNSDGNSSHSKKANFKGDRLIIVYAGGKDGSVSNSLLMFNAEQNGKDKRQNMTDETHTNWLKTQLIPNLKPNSVVVVNNLTYHNSLRNPAPNADARKQEMLDWLTYHNIEHSATMLKPQLYQLILQNKDILAEYKLDALLKEHNHSVLRLPHNHQDLNPIESIWPIIKNHVAKKNMSMHLEAIKELVKEKLDTITANQWETLCDRAKWEEKKFDGRDAAIDALTEKIITVEDTSEGSGDENEEAMSGVEDSLQNDVKEEPKEFDVKEETTEIEGVKFEAKEESMN